MPNRTHSLLHETLTILKPFRLLVALSTILGVIGGLGITALLATMNEAMNMTHGPDTYLALTFGGLCLLVLACTTLSNLSINYIGQHVVLKLRQRLAKQILAAPIVQLERYRSHKLIPVLVGDINIISAFALNIAPLVISFAVTLGCLSYLAYLSWQVLLLTLATVVVGSGAQYIAFRFGSSHLGIARDAENDLQKAYQALSEGAKELRIQRPRRLHLFSKNIQGTTDKICKANIKSANIFIGAESFGSMLFFAVIGMAIAFQALWPTADKAMLGGFVLVMLYMKGPLEHIVGTLPEIALAQVAFQRIADLSEKFSSPEPYLLLNEDQDEGHNEANNTAKQASSNTSHEETKPATLKSLELNQVFYEFPSVDNLAPFKLGPINIKIKQGDIVFIVGENGGGKTTLIKLLLGLYVPQQGQIMLDGKTVTAQYMDDYRQLFTTIFSDFYLFDELLNAEQDLPQQANKYLKKMKIDHKVTIKDGAFTTTDLSTGQRKRLALINAWLEERPVLVFDEWAADQDPSFRRIFYTQLLPDLKKLGKTIIVISHDDRYFNIADQLVRMENGNVISEDVITEPEIISA
ncbi:MAG: cyclic peptide export ABC transporter [Gammaproteobacteria bacterium]|nr:cyclic peptide export ABC transporter [Gammaproteobacteria bacterium]